MYFETVLIAGYNENSTVPLSAAISTNVLNRMDHLEVISTYTSKIPEITDSNIGTILEHRIQTNWQFMLIMACVLIALTTIYLGRCVHRHWKSRAHQVRNINTTAPNRGINESHQIEYIYEEMQNVEYEDPERYRTVACDDNSGNVINTSQEKMDSVSVIPIMSSLEPSTDETLNGHNISENTMYENQPKIDMRETGDLYLSPTV